MFGFNKEPEKPMDKSPWDRIRVLTATGKEVLWNANTTKHRVVGDTLFILENETDECLAEYPRFTGVDHTNVYWMFQYGV